MKLFAVYLDNSEMDQICESLESAKSEKREFIHYGHTVKILEISSDYSGNAELAAYAADETMRETGRFGRKAARAIEETIACSIRFH